MVHSAVQLGSTGGCEQYWDDALGGMETHVRGKPELCSTRGLGALGQEGCRIQEEEDGFGVE